MRARWTAWLVLLCGLAAARPAAAQGDALSQDIETSIRAAGMGGATTAVSWGEPGPWGNPASLAGVRGLAWLTASTKLAPELAGDLTFESNRFLAGGAGLGFTFMGQPVSGMGHTRLEYGVSGGTDPFGDPIATRTGAEEIEGWGVGVSPVQLLDAWRARRSPESRPWSQRADVSFGWQQKSTELSPAPGATATADNSDWGVQARVAILPGDHEGREARLELGAGYALLNADDASRFDFADGSTPSPSTRMERRGASVHATLPFAGAADEGVAPWGWWFATVPRAVELGLAFDRETRSASGSAVEADVDHVGFEASLMGILTGRLGYVGDPAHDIEGVSFGFGVHLPLGPWASVGYDYANVPRTPDSDPLSRNGFAIWFRPLALWQGTHE